jgi:tRNA(Ile)-lysidine synthase
VLLQLLRGTGLKGVAAMPELRALPGTKVRLWRPFLAIPRAQILEHATAAGLEWIEDESNASTAHDRNYFRHELAPRLDARFPGWRDAVARFSRHAGSAQDLLDELALRDGVTAAGLPLDEGLSDDRRANALRAFLAVNFVAMPSEARLAEMAKQLYGARGDAQVRIEHAGVALVRHRGIGRIDRETDDSGWRVEWHGEPELDLGPGRGSVHFERVRGEGLSAERVQGSEWHFMPRAGGEKIRLDARRPTRTLKNLLQEFDLPPWQRQRLPLLFQGERLAWVPGIGIAAEYACGPGEEGFLPSWTVAGGAPLC